MVARIMTNSGDWRLADVNEVIGSAEIQPPEYDFFGNCPKALWGMNPVYNPKTNEWEAGSNV